MRIGLQALEPYMYGLHAKKNNSYIWSEPVFKEIPTGHNGEVSHKRPSL